MVSGSYCCVICFSDRNNCCILISLAMRVLLRAAMEMGSPTGMEDKFVWFLRDGNKRKMEKTREIPPETATDSFNCS